jgi:hypothetical protein
MRQHPEDIGAFSAAIRPILSADALCSTPGSSAGVGRKNRSDRFNLLEMRRRGN